jgi:hypothetical protein
VPVTGPTHRRESVHLGLSVRMVGRASACRAGSRPKTMLTEASSHVEIDVPRDRAGTAPVVKLT